LPHTNFSRILARANTLMAAPTAGKTAPRRTMSEIPEQGYAYHHSRHWRHIKPWCSAII